MSMVIQYHTGSHADIIVPFKPLTQQNNRDFIIALLEMQVQTKILHRFLVERPYRGPFLFWLELKFKNVKNALTKTWTMVVPITSAYKTSGVMEHIAGTPNISQITPVHDPQLKPADNNTFGCFKQLSTLHAKTMKLQNKKQNKKKPKHSFVLGEDTFLHFP